MPKHILGYGSVIGSVLLFILQEHSLIIIIVAYVPTADCKKDEVDGVYQTLEDTSQCNSYDVDIIMGDLRENMGYEQDSKAVGGVNERETRHLFS